MNTRVFFYLIYRDFGDCRLKFGAIWWEISRLWSCCSDRWGWNWLWIYFWCDVRLLRRGFQCAVAHSWRMRSKIPAPFCPAASKLADVRWAPPRRCPAATLTARVTPTARGVNAPIYICSVNRETCFLLGPISELIPRPWDRGPSPWLASDSWQGNKSLWQLWYSLWLQPREAPEDWIWDNIQWGKPISLTSKKKNNRSKPDTVR